jgi:hypothetical protein
MKMKWCIPRRREQPLTPRGDAHTDSSTADFNGPLPENGGEVCIADGNEADDDIREGKVKTFSNPEDMIKSLNRPW